MRTVSIPDASSTRTRKAVRQVAWAAALALISSLGSTGLARSSDVDTKLGGALKFESADKKFSAQIGGRVQQDWAFVKANDDAKKNFGAASIDGTEFRRARLFVAGKMYGNISYKAEYDFVNSIPDYRDVYIELTGLPFGAVRVGNFYEQFCLEEMTSDNYINFLERSAVDVFAPGRNPGVMVHNTFADSRGTWAAGIYREDTSPGISQENGAYAQTGRVTFLPMNEDDGEKLVHLGLAVSQRRPPAKTRRYSLRPPAHLAKSLVSTGSFAAQRALLIGGEAAMVQGPFSVQGEVGIASHTAPDELDVEGKSDPSFMAFYVQGSYFVTGEHRPYKKSDGAFDRVSPKRNFGEGNGAAGALELAGRFSYGDLEDPDNGIAGGKLSDITLGANWYLNSHTRVLVNYVMALPKRTVSNEGSSMEVDGTVNVLQTRFAIDF
ncbi:MAG: porin [Candidatus Eisenbacteria bacterium]|uniref:Porin n=1 Tax=Eiseniibacteriota bacterium TaxID=2212470 RepID=A0A956RNW5_UNCEI|nr:hypothetical protein [Candidatus Eisenbacteria bacterium]